MSADTGGDEQGSGTTAVKIQAYGKKYGFSVWDDRVYSDVRRLLIEHDNIDICSVQIEYIDKNGESKWRSSSNHGRHDGSVDKVDLDYPNEYLISIHGYYSENGIKSLTLESNTRTWGPYGQEKGTKFSFPIMGAKIIGFHGWANRSKLTAIGVYVQPITKKKSSQLKPKSKVEPVPQPQSLLPPEHYSLGQYGCEDGKCWVETFRAIKRLVIYCDDERVTSIQMDYEDENGKFVSSKKHGGDEDSPYDFEVDFQYPDEYLITIDGYYDNSLNSKSATNMIRSLTVRTNQNIYGPFGSQSGTKFSFPTDGQLKVVGIHGKSDKYLNAIGLHVAPAF